MKVIVAVILLFSQSILFSGPRFILESELRTGYAGPSQKSSFTHYTYDSEGNMAKRRVFDGVDSNAALMSRVIYSHDSKDRLTKELLLGAGGDTLSMVRYVHGDNGLLSASTLRKDGTLRYKDSLLYDDGKLVEERRYTAKGSVSFYRRYNYKSKLLSADSLYVPNGNGFSAAKARLISRNDDGTVSREAQWRLAGGEWYRVSTAIMAYREGRLVSTATYEGDGAAKRLIDSLAWSHDSQGNRTKEEHYDNEREKSYDIVFAWHDTRPESVLPESGRKGPRAVSWHNGRLEFGAPFSGSLLILKAGCGLLNLLYLSHLRFLHSPFVLISYCRESWC